MIRLPCQMHTSFPCVHFGSPTSWFTLITLCSALSANENEACYQTLVCQSSRWNQSCSRGSCKLVVYLDRFGFDNYLFCHLSSSNNILCNSRTIQLHLYYTMEAWSQAQPSPGPAQPSSEGWAWHFISLSFWKPSQNPRPEPKLGLAHH